MGKRYSNINQGAELKRAQDALTNYRRNRQTKRTTGGTPGKSRSRIDVSVLPFGSAGTDRALVSTTGDSYTKLSTVINTRTSKDDKTIAASSKFDGFQPARLHYFSPDNDQRSYVQSKQTGLFYLRYNGINYSAPFGATAKTEEYEAAARTLKAAALAIDGNKEFRRAWIKGESFSV